MISLKSTTNVIDVEEKYEIIYDRDSSVVRLPEHLKGGGAFRVVPALIQFVSTWSRVNEDGKLLTYSNKVGAHTFDNLLQRPYGLISAFVAPHLLDSKQTVLERNSVLANAAATIEAMQSRRYVDTYKGPGLFLTCFSGAKNEFLLPLYSKPQKGALRGIEDFKVLTKEILNTCIPRVVESINVNDLDSIALLIRELFENTDDHASTDENGSTYSWAYPCSRSIIARRVSFDATDFGAFEGDQPHSIFIANSILNRSKSSKSTKRLSKTDFIELSVIDGGVGIAKIWHKHKAPDQIFEDISLNKELSLVKEAFQFSKTSKSSSGTGHGLTNVLVALRNLKAFLHVRTGRLSLYQDFSGGSRHKQRTGGKVEFQPQYWETSTPENYRAEGTAYSILIPSPTSENT